MSSFSIRVSPSNIPIRCAGALALVWVLSFAVYPLHLTAPVAAVWIIATVVLVPIGTTLTDRVVGLLLLAAAPAVLIAWFTPFAPWLVSPPVLTGLLGSLVALAWGMGWTRPPVTRLQDWVTIGLGVLTAAFYWLPFATGGLVRAIGVLSQGPDTQQHFGMWMRVWANHGYLLFNTLPDPDYWNWRVYPQGAQALLADIGSVLTGASNPPTQMEQSVGLFAILVCLQAGVLALVAAWSVDRLSRSRRNPILRRVVIFQILAALLVAVGPGSVMIVQSVSFTIGLVVIIPALAWAATARRSPRRAGLLVGASLIAAAASYPILALLAVVLWPLYLWTSQRYWLASNLRRWYCATVTAVVSLLCLPTFVLMVLRNLDHSWDTAGHFPGLHVSVYDGVAILLALLIVFARGRLPGPVQYALWVATAVSVALVAKGISEWFTVGGPYYYTVKTMYLGWMLAVIAVGAGLATIRKRRASTVLPPWKGAPRLVGVSVAAAFVICSILVSLRVVWLDEQVSSVQTWSRALSRQGWLISNAASYDRFGMDIAEASQYAVQHEGVTVFVPCASPVEISVNKWVLVLGGGLNQVEADVNDATCVATAEAPLGALPYYLQVHPEIEVNALARDQGIYEYALEVRDAFKLLNLHVVPPSVR